MSKIKIYPNYLVNIDDNFVDPISIKNQSSLDQQTKISEEYYLTKMVYEYIEADLEGIFKKTSIERFPQANFQYIALARLSKKSWQYISLELGMPIEHLSSFFQNCCQTFAVKFKQNIKVLSSENIIREIFQEF
ncbi:MAG: hypothetical protein ACRC2S_24000 [Waterburya sp.]